VEGRTFTDMTIQEVSPGADAGLFTLPDDYDEPNRVELSEASDASRHATVDEVADGVYLIRNLRGGFHPMFIEFADFVVAIDAPAGYRLLNELPAGDVAPGPSSAWLSQRYLELIQETVPDKPVRYVVVTHFHNDHAGGVRAFIAEGTTVLASPSAAPAIRELARAPHTLAPDQLARAPRPLQLEVVDGMRSVSDGRRNLEIIDVGSNPHTSSMLIAHLPDEDLLFVSDLMDGGNLEDFPSPSHARLDRFFAAWLDDRGWVPERIFTMHGSGLVTPEHLERLRGDDR
jgi:glyoxylase-like metal-dependent hydrolase (beta-lactamase superfamily II)